MTNEELAKHWSVSLEEARRISDFMNTNFYSVLARHKKTGLFYPLMYKMHEAPDGEITPHLFLSSKKGFEKAQDAVQFWNEMLNNHTYKYAEALWGVPADAFKALKKLELPAPIPHKTRGTRITLERGPRE